MSNADEKQPAAPSAPAAKKGVTQAATGAVVGTSVIVVMVELARSGALQQYKEVLAPLIGWGPGILILLAFFWLANTYAPPLIESHNATAKSLQRLADAVAYNDGSCHDLVLATQVNSDKLEQLRSTVGELQQHVGQCKEGLRDGRK
jgi:hypothetical protein